MRISSAPRMGPHPVICFLINKVPRRAVDCVSAHGEYARTKIAPRKGVREDSFETLSDEPLYLDRHDAGRRLAAKLEVYADEAREGNLLVLALPRDGVPVAYEVARTLAAPLDVLVVRKLGVPGHEGLAMGAIASGEARVLNDTVIRGLRIPAEAVDAAARREERVLREREQSYRGDRPWPSLKDQTVILIDDGLATGATMRAAIMALREQEPAKIVVGVPVSSPESCDEIAAEVDEIVCASTPPFSFGAAQWYRDLSHTTDAEVRELLSEDAPPPTGKDPIGGGGDQR